MVYSRLLSSQGGSINFTSDYISTVILPIKASKILLPLALDTIGVTQSSASNFTIAFYAPLSTLDKVSFISSKVNEGGAFYAVVCI